MRQHNFEWTSNLIFSLNRNKIITITGEKYDVFDKDGNFVGQKEPDDKTNNWFIGQAKDVIWDYKILGTWKIGQEEEAAKHFLPVILPITSYSIISILNTNSLQTYFPFIIWLF